MRLWRLESLRICRLQAVDPGKARGAIQLEIKGLRTRGASGRYASPKAGDELSNSRSEAGKKKIKSSLLCLFFFCFQALDWIMFTQSREGNQLGRALIIMTGNSLTDQRSC